MHQTEHYLAQSGDYPQKHPWEIIVCCAEVFESPSLFLSSVKLGMQQDLLAFSKWQHLNSQTSRVQVKNVYHCNNLPANSI